MSTTTPIMKCIDHIVIRVDDTNFSTLFSLLYDTFQLPVAWPVLVQPSFKSGGIFAGNINLEIIRYGPPQNVPTSTTPSDARLFSIVFELASPTESLRELKKRRIPHTPALSYTQPEAEAGDKKIVMWKSVILGNLLGNSPLANLFIALTKLVPSRAFANASSRETFGRSSLASKLMERAFSNGIIYTVEYNREFVDVDAWHVTNKEALNTRQGGPLGLISVKEVIIGMADFEGSRKRWQNLLAPAPEDAPGRWPIGDGPAIHLIPHDRDAIVALVLKVASLEKAKVFLAEKGLLGTTSEQEIRIAPEKIRGLDVRLVGNNQSA